MTIAEATRLERPALPSTKPGKQIDLRQPSTPPTLDAALAGIVAPGSYLRGTIDHVLSQYPRWAMQCAQNGAEVPTLKQVRAWVWGERRGDVSAGEKLTNAPFNTAWRAIWSQFRSDHRLSIAYMEAEAAGNPDATALADALAGYAHGTLAAFAEDMDARRRAKAASNGAVERAMAELAPLLERAIPQLEALAAALSDAGRRDDAGEVRRNFVGAFGNLAAGKFRLPRD